MLLVEIRVWIEYSSFSDIHGNHEAWKRVLADILEVLQAEGVVATLTSIAHGDKPARIENKPLGFAFTVPGSDAELEVIVP